MTFNHYNEETKKMEYYFRSIPSKVITSDATLEEMWTHDELPLFLLENGSTSLEYTL